jgi:signal recognition particle subunit SRP72
MLSERNSFLRDHPSDVHTKAVLAALCSATSASEASHYSSSLPSVSTFTKNVESQKLELQGIPSTATQLAAQKPKSTVTSKRKRRVRGGKVFDSTQKVDPERWLPLRERSYYKPAKSKKRKTGGATQGGAVEEESMSRSDSANVDVKKADSGGKKKKKNRK